MNNVALLNNFTMDFITTDAIYHLIMSSSTLNDLLRYFLVAGLRTVDSDVYNGCVSESIAGEVRFKVYSSVGGSVLNDILPVS